MAKIKSSDTLSLDKSKQKKVVKQTKKLKEKIRSGKISLKPTRGTRNNDGQNRGLIYIGHIPHGFYETEMKKYFNQFGTVTNLKVCRSNKSGNSKGFGYVEFLHPDVAKIAAETMNNYLMFKKRIVAEYVPFEKRPKSIFKGKSSNLAKYSTKTRIEKQRIANKTVDQERHLARSKARISRLSKKLEKLNKAGINYNFKPVDLPENLQQNKNSNSGEHVVYEFQQDPYDSDIEIKVPIKRKSQAKEVVSKEVTPKKLTKTATAKATPKIVKKESSKQHTPKVTPKPSPIVRKQTPKGTPKSTKQTQEQKRNLLKRRSAVQKL